AVSFFGARRTGEGSVKPGRVDEGVRLFRDQPDNMDWAVGQQTESPAGEPLMGTEREHADSPPLGGGGGDPVDYRIETAVPQNWIPFLPVAISANNVTGEIVLQRGEMLPAALAAPIKPKGRILRPSRLASDAL